MYDAQRNVEEEIYDYFADSLKVKHLVATPDLYQSLRLKLAEASKSNPLLATAMANAARVDKDLDLVSAAKAAAVIETLDEIAYGASGEFLLARRAIMEGAAPPPETAATASERAKLQEQREASCQAGRAMGQGTADAPRTASGTREVLRRQREGPNRRPLLQRRQSGRKLIRQYSVDKD